jgi:hypothetical protein
MLILGLKYRAAWLGAGVFLAGQFVVTASPAINALSRFWSPDGAVHSICETNGTLYLGGEFLYVGPTTGSAAAVDATSGARIDGFPVVNGPVYAVVADGAGGWFIGGTFNKVGSVNRYSVAHILADKTVDASWGGSGALGTVGALALSGSTLYVGGQFSSFNGELRAGLAALNAATGALVPWNPNPSSLSFPNVRALAISGSNVYVGGLFTSLGGIARTNLAAVHATTGTVLPWNPGANNSVNVLLASGPVVFAGGAFSKIANLYLTNIAALNASDGSAVAWTANNANGPVFALAVSGSTLYAGGVFTRMGGATNRIGIAALDTATGAATSWNPGQSSVVGNSNAVGIVRSMVLSGTTLFVGGHFKVCGGQLRLYTAALSTSTGAAVAWNPGANFDVYSLELSGNTLFAGGEFTSLGGVMRTNLAALDIATGAATAWAPFTDHTGVVNSLAAAGTRVYVGGAYSTLNNQPRRSIAAVDRLTGTLDTWNPNPPGGLVRAMLPSGTNIVLGGSFVTIGGQNRTNLAAISQATGLATAWSPNANSSGQVYCLAQAGSVIYAGGDFTTIGGQSRARIAALDASTGLATAWNPGASNSVRAVAVGAGMIYAGGIFQKIGGLNRTNIAALNLTDGAALAGWDAGLSRQFGFFVVNAIAVRTNQVYIAGIFDTGSTSGNLCGELDSATGTASSWLPIERLEVYFHYSGSAETGEAIALTPDTLYLAGTIPGYAVGYMFLPPVGPPQLVSPSLVNGVFHCLLLGKDGLSYTIDYTTDFQSWNFLDSVVPSGGVADVMDGLAGPEPRFYRAWSP